MFIGHYAVGLALKRATPRTSLGWLIAAPQLLDMLWPALLLAGVEHARVDPGNTPVTPLAFDSYPISHSLVMAGVWALLLGAMYFRRTHFGRGAIWLAIAVVSHWVLDWISHRPDMPLAPWSDVKVGLGMWYSRPLTVTVEALLFAAGVWLYLSATRARDRVGVWSFVAFVAVLAGIYAANLFGPPPPDIRSVAIAGLALWLFPFWAAWFDGHRATVARAHATFERT